MRIEKIMSRNVQVAQPGETIQTVAQRMRELDCGAIPVCDGATLKGMVTDRDIAVRAVGEGRSFESAVESVMTPGVETCFETDDIADAADKMAKLRVRRLAVLDRNQQLVGIVSLGDIAQQGKDKTTGQALEQISEPTHHA